MSNPMLGDAPNMTAERGRESTSRQRWSRTLYAVGGALVAVIVGVTINVISEQANDLLATPVPETSFCATDSNSFQKVGEQFVDVLLSEPDVYCWSRTLSGVEPGGSFRVLVEFKNNTGTQIDDVTLQAWLPDGFELVPGSTRWGNNRYPNGLSAGDAILETGLNLGSYLGGANAWVVFEARMSPNVVLECGLSAWVVAGRLPQAPAPDNDWVTAAIVSFKRC